jgi:hypothetical protein
MRKHLLAVVSSVSFLITVAVALIAHAEDQTFTIGEGKLQLAAPANWSKKQPASRIVEAEYSVPPAKGDENAGRLTAMGAGGSVESNIDRWAKQFAPPGGDAPKPKLDKTTVGGAEVVIVDLSGTYQDTLGGGPFAGGKTVSRDNYRMLGAIIQTKEAGNYFLKLYGPKATIDENAKGFQDMVKSLKVK